MEDHIGQLVQLLYLDHHQHLFWDNCPLDI